MYAAIAPVSTAGGLDEMAEKIIQDKAITTPCKHTPALLRMKFLPTYHGMTAEQVLWAWFKSEILCPKRLVFRSDSYYYEAMQPAIRAGIKRKRGLPMKKNTHDSEETA